MNPTTNKLRSKVGASAGLLLDRQARAQAEASVQTLAPEAFVSCERRVQEICDVLEGLPDRALRDAFALAHEIRGVAGTFGWNALGEIADCLCLYLDDFPEGGRANVPLLQSLAGALKAALRSQGDADLVLALSAECRAMVRVIREREGRSPDLL